MQHFKQLNKHHQTHNCFRGVWIAICQLKVQWLYFQGGKSCLMCGNVTLRDGAFDKMEIQSL